MEQTPEWVWQGFEGPADVAAAEKQLHDAIAVTIIGIMVPPRGAPPLGWSTDGSRAMFAIAVRPSALMPCPARMLEAAPQLVGRLVGA